MLNPDFDLLESNVQLNLLTFRQKFLARLHTAGRSAEHPDGLFGEHYHLSRKLYAQQFSGRNDGPQIPALGSTLTPNNVYVAMYMYIYIHTYIQYE